jgi:hypothetical protein
VCDCRGTRQKKNNPQRRKKLATKKTSAEELDSNSVIVVELGNEPFLFVEVL